MRWPRSTGCCFWPTTTKPRLRKSSSPSGKRRGGFAGIWRHHLPGARRRGRQHATRRLRHRRRLGGQPHPQNLPLLFPTPASGFDTRAMFFTNGQSLEINDLTQFTEGYGVTKWRNKTSTGANGNDPQHIFVDTDFPAFPPGRRAARVRRSRAARRHGRHPNPGPDLREPAARPRLRQYRRQHRRPHHRWPS